MSETIQVEPSFYKIFEKELEDISTDSLQYIEYMDWNLNSTKNLTDFRIDINDKDEYFIPQKAYLECRFSVTSTAANPVAINVDENIGPQNNAVGFFKTWELWMDSTVIERVDDADICNTLQSLIYFSKEYSDSIAHNQFWYPDTTNTSVNDVNPGAAALNAIETVNLGHRKRRFLVKTEAGGGIKEVSVHIPLVNVFGFLKAYGGVLKGIVLSLRLSKNDDNRTLLREAGDGLVDRKLNINYVSVWIPRVKPHVTTLSLLESKLAQPGPYFITYIDTQIYRSNLFTEGAKNRTFQIRVKRKRPIKVFIAFQLRDQVEGGQNFVKRTFNNVGLRDLHVELNSTTKYPEYEYSCQFTDNRRDYARVYNELLRAGLRDHDIHDGSLVTFENFFDLFPIFCVDMTNQGERIVEPVSALINIVWTNDTGNYYMWVLVESERKIEIAASKGMMRFIKSIS